MDIPETVDGHRVTSIGAYAFHGCTDLTRITIPDSVTEIGAYAFAWCTALTSVTIPDSVMSIGEGAFVGTPWYNNQPDGVVYINRVLYKYKGEMPDNTHIVVRDGTVSISAYAFYGCDNLQAAYVPADMTTAELKHAFERPSRKYTAKCVDVITGRAPTPKR